MHTFTSIKRWLLAVVVVLAATGTAQAQRNVTLRLNTASLPDTVDALDVMEIRGALDGNAPANLPDGNVIGWGAETTLRAVNVGGDYWEANFQIPDNAELQHKFFTGAAEGEFKPGGWEDGGNNPRILAGTGDYDGGLRYFNKTGGDVEYNVDPFFSDKPEGTVGVHYRVYMCTVAGLAKNYNPNDSGQTIGVRGTPEQGILDWGLTNVTLTRENNANGTPGFDMYSGTVFYPESSIGMEQAYKYILTEANGNIGWEDSADQKFTIPASDTTLAWRHFSFSEPALCGGDPETSTVIFAVDLSPLEEIGLFNKSRGDTLQVRGGFNGWDCDNPSDCLLLPFPGTNVFEAAVVLTGYPGTSQTYKYLIDFNDENFIAAFGENPPSGWEEPVSTTGADRRFDFAGDPNTEQWLLDPVTGGDVRFNDVLEDNIVPAGSSMDVTFTVDMTPALTANEPFVPGTHAVMMEFTGDALWAFTQGIPRNDNGDFIIDDSFQLTDMGDNIYSGTFTLVGPTYAVFQYKYSYSVPGSLVYNTEGGGSTAGLGRRRTRFVPQMPDGSLRTAFSVAPEVFQSEGNLPYDCNPAASADCNLTVGVDQVGSELPSQVALSQNFPNPFNPTTSFEYAINRTMDVKVRVYDLLGRVVATLVDGTQQAATYRVGFDASELSSGMYIYRLETPTQVISKTMILLK